MYPLGRLFSSRYHNVLWKSTPSVLDHRHVGYSLVAFSHHFLAVSVSIFQLLNFLGIFCAWCLKRGLILFSNISYSADSNLDLSNSSWLCMTIEISILLSYRICFSLPPDWELITLPAVYTRHFLWQSPYGIVLLITVGSLLISETVRAPHRAGQFVRGIFCALNQQRGRGTKEKTKRFIWGALLWLVKIAVPAAPAALRILSPFRGPLPVQIRDRHGTKPYTNWQAPLVLQEEKKVLAEKLDLPARSFRRPDRGCTAVRVRYGSCGQPLFWSF